MPANKDYLYIPTTEQQQIMDSLANKLRVDASAIDVDTNGDMHITLPEGVDSKKVIEAINSYDEKAGLKNNEIPDQIARLDEAGKLTIDMEQMRDLAAVYKDVQQQMPDGSYKTIQTVSYNGYSDFEEAIRQGGQVVYDTLDKQNPTILPRNVAGNLEATLGVPVQAGLGGQYALSINATPEARQRIADIIEKNRNDAGLSEVAIINDGANGQILITGTATDVEKLNAALVEQGAGQAIAPIIAGNAMQYDRKITRGGAGAVQAASDETGKTFVIGDDGKPVEVDSDGKAVKPEDQARLAGSTALASAPVVAQLASAEIVPQGALAVEVAELQTKADNLSVKTVEQHLDKGYVVTENTKTKKTNVAVEAIAEKLGVEITKDGDLTKEEIQALQEKVGAKRNSRGEFDGIIGADTLAQIKKAMQHNNVSVTEVSSVSAPTTAAAAAKSAGAGMDMA
ncbi:MAG: hypothetical protein U1E36_08600 [Rickettsiales bacterium]